MMLKGFLFGFLGMVFAMGALALLCIGLADSSVVLTTLGIIAVAALAGGLCAVAAS